MFLNFKKLLGLLSPKEIRKGFFLVILVFFTAVVDSTGIISILPFIAVLTNQSLIETNVFLNTTYILFNSYGVNTHREFIILLGIFFFIILFFSMILKSIVTYLQVSFINLREFSISKRLISLYLNQPYSWFININSSDLTKKILSEVKEVIDKGIAPIVIIISQIIILTIILIVLIIVDPLLTFFILITFIFSYVLIYFFTKNILTFLGKSRLETNKLKFSSVSEVFRSFKQVKISGLENEYIKRFSKPAKIFSQNHALANTIGQIPRFIIEVISFGGMLLLIIFLTYKDKDFVNSLPIITLFALAGYRILPSLQQIYGAMTQLRFAGPAINSLSKDIISLKSQIQIKNYENLNFKEKIKLNFICFKYPHSKVEVLKNISLEINSCSTVGFVGLSGSGKTTLIDIILGLLDPTKGSLEVDGKQINFNNLGSWQNEIGYVTQNIFLTDENVTSNIAFGLPSNEIDFDSVIQAAKIANIHDFIESDLPDQYNTNLGENGIKLSGGQRQRIGIARALYKKPKLLVLDEATSSLDNITERKVMKSIKQLYGNTTVIIITHKLSTLVDCDNIFVLEQGEIKEKGTFKTLSTKSSFFKNSH